LTGTAGPAVSGAPGNWRATVGYRDPGAAAVHGQELPRTMGSFGAANAIAFDVGHHVAAQQGKWIRKDLT